MSANGGGNGSGSSGGAAGDGPGRREVAHRVFAAEYDDATHSYSVSDEERAPSYVVTPTGARANRLFVAGVVTAVEPAGESNLRARVVDPTGAFVVYAGQYEPDALAAIRSLDPPAFVAVTGKARTFESEDGERTFSTLRPETVNEIDADTRDRWVVRTAEHTLARIGAFDEALSRPERGDDLRRALLADGVEPSLAAGIPRALSAYGTTRTYLAAVRDLALDAARVVANERESVPELDVAPADGGGDPVTDSLAVDLGATGSVATAVVDPDETTVEETAAAASAGAGGGGPTEATADAGAESVDEDAGAGADSAAADSATADGAAADGATTDGAAADGATSDSAGADTTTAEDAELGGTTDSAAGAAVDDTTSAESASDADPTGSPESEASAAEASASGTPESAPARTESADPAADETDGTVAGTEADTGATTVTGDALDADEGSESDDGFDADDALEPEEMPETDELYELDEEEREEVEEEFGVEFTTGSDVPSPGEADLETPSGDAAEPAADPDAGPAADSEDDSADDSATDDADSDVADADETADAMDGADETDEAVATATEASTEEPAGDEQSLEDDVVAAMRELAAEGDGSVGRAALVDRVTADRDASADAVDDAIQDALMSGRCYESGDGEYTPI